MFPFATRVEWYRTGYAGHLRAIAETARPRLLAPARVVLDERIPAYRRWSAIREALLAFLVVSAVLAVSGWAATWFGLATQAAFMAATGAASAGVVTVALAIVARHVNRIEADIWGLLVLDALGPSPMATAAKRSSRATPKR